MRQSHWVQFRLHRFFAGYSVGFGGGSSRATTGSLKPELLWEPSQNGLLAECPQRHSPMAVGPASPKDWPAGSTISKSPSTRIDPLLLIVILAAAILASEKVRARSAVYRSSPDALSRLRRVCWELKEAAQHPQHPRYLILGNAGIDFIRPGEDSALEIENFAEAGLAEEIDGFCRALSAAA